MEAAEALPSVMVFRAGVETDGSGGLLTAGGRVLNVTATGPTLTAARERAYAAAARISWPGMRYRGDIALEAASLDTSPESGDPERAKIGR
jgi:phosphoribosylamine--glycine ligase